MTQHYLKKELKAGGVMKCWHEPCCTGKAMIAELADSDRLTREPKLETSGGPLESLFENENTNGPNKKPEYASK
jgi:hypothetical protein